MAVLACALCHVRISFASDPAVVTLTQDGISTDYTDLAMAIGAITADADLLVHTDCSLGAGLSVENRKVTIHADGLGAVITPISEDFQKAENTPFEIGSDGELVLSNVVFRGFERFANAGTKGAVFVHVKKDGTFRMQNGARLENIDNAYGTYGAIKGEGGSKTILESGSALVGCRAMTAGNANGYGGAIYLSSEAELFLRGGVISNCVAKTYGGGVCASATARIFISGPSVVWGNVKENDSGSSQDNIYVSGAPNTPVFTINSSVEGGKLGVGYSNNPRNNEGSVVATFAEGLSDEEKAASAAAFFSDKNGDWYNGVVGAVSADNLVWGPTNREQGTVPEEEGTIVVDRAGKLLYFTDITAAFARLTGGVARVTLKADAVVTNGISSTTTGMSDNVDIWNIPICGEVTLDGAGHTIGRGGNYRFLVTGGENSLMVTNVTLKGETLQGVKAGDCSFLRAENGGLIVLEAGATIRNVVSVDWRLRTSAAVSVFNAAKLVMRDGADIACCTNAYNDESAGGGVIVTSTNSVFRFEGGTIRNCSAVQGGGVQIENSATIIITGSGKIMDNAGGNVCVADQSYLVLGDVFSGSIGHTAGVAMDRTAPAPAVFGRVADNCPVSAEELVSSAANFYRDADSSIRGCIVTNDTAKLLVWANAITNGVYVDTKNNGVRYYAVESSEPPEDPPEEPVEEQEWSVETNYPTPIAFQSILQIDEKTWQLVMTNREPYCRYRLIYTDDLKKGFIHTDKWEKVLSEVDPVWTTNIVCEGTAWFWRAEGTFGTNMILKVETPEP